jgi:undecaprenyl diphosphate synthase
VKNIIVPVHVAIIMDGNRRWAKKKGLQSVLGHSKGKEALHNAISSAIKHNIKYLTCYAFSSENWDRSKEEIEYLKNLLLDYLVVEKGNFIDNQISLKVIGDYKKFGNEIANKIEEIINLTKDFDKLNLIIALNYGSREEIVHAINNIIKDMKNNVIIDSKIDEYIINKYLYTVDIPEPDLIIRTGGDKRLSNFLLWQSIYSELIFLDVMWPDFNEIDFNNAILEYSGRERRKGK